MLKDCKGAERTSYRLVREIESENESSPQLKMTK